LFAEQAAHNALADGQTTRMVLSNGFYFIRLFFEWA
jgi:hypothetical protein